MRKFADVLLQVDSRKLHKPVLAHFGAVRRGKLYLDIAAEAQGLVVLRELIVLGAVRVEIIFSIPFCDFGNFAAEHKPKLYRLADSLEIEHGEHPR